MSLIKLYDYFGHRVEVVRRYGVLYVYLDGEFYSSEDTMREVDEDLEEIRNSLGNGVIAL